MNNSFLNGRVKTVLLTISLLHINWCFAADLSSLPVIKQNGMVSEVITSSVSDQDNKDNATANNIKEVIKENNSEAIPMNKKAVSPVSTVPKLDDSASVKTTAVSNNSIAAPSSGNTDRIQDIKNIQSIDQKLTLNDQEIHRLAKHENQLRAKKRTKPLIEKSVALKEIMIADNEQVNITLSNHDINRIVVKGDKIQGVNGPAGLYNAKNDPNGAIYISVYGETTFTIFLSTIKGNNLSLLVTPRSIAGRTIIFKATNLLDDRFETDSYQKMLVEFMTSIINSEIPVNDSRYKKSKWVNFYGMADIKQLTSYSGTYLDGNIYEIKNKSKKPLTLKPSYFYQRNVRAIALSQQTIAPGTSGLIYQVVGNGYVEERTGESK